MKKLFLIIAMVLTIGVVKAQDYIVEDGYMKMTQIYEDTNLSADQTHERMTLFFGSLFNNVNETCKVNTPAKLLYKFVDDVAVFNKGLGVYHTFFAEYELEISIKDGRMRAVLVVNKVNCNELYSYNGYNPVDAYPIAAEHNAFVSGVTKKQAQTIIDGIIESKTALFSSIGEALQEHEEEDNW